MHAAIDISSNNQVTSFKRIKDAGIEHVFIKLTGGTEYYNWKAPDWRKLARSVGLTTSFYHFRDDGTPGTGKAEAVHFLHYLPPFAPGEWRPFLDFETGKPEAQWVRDFNAECRLVRHVLPAFYSYPDFIRQIHAPDPLGAGLLLSAFSRNDGVEHPYSIPAPWQHAVGHQFTSRGRVPGVVGYVDLWDIREPKALALS